MPFMLLSSVLKIFAKPLVGNPAGQLDLLRFQLWNPTHPSCQPPVGGIFTSNLIGLLKYYSRKVRPVTSQHL